MNPVTQNLLQQLPNHAVHPFVHGWDRLESLAITIFRAKDTSTEDIAEHAAIITVLQTEYPAWRAALEPHWQRVKIKGQSLQTDPFAALIELPAANWTSDWQAMQTLPAAREALNELLVELIAEMKNEQ